MIKSKLVDSNSKSTFEMRLNEALKEIQPHNFIDVKYSSTLCNNNVQYSAIIIYKEVEGLQGDIGVGNY